MKRILLSILLIVANIAVSFAQYNSVSSDERPQPLDESWWTYGWRFLERQNYDISNYRCSYDFTTSDYPAVHHAGEMDVSSHVNQYTGTNIVSVPITEGVDLVYAGNGIKVDQIASWVGLGWQLNAGGTISRMVRDLPDDKILDYSDNWGLLLCWGWLVFENNDRIYSFPEQVIAPQWNTPSEQLFRWSGSLHSSSQGEKFDFEPDVFQVNLGGLNCSFYFDIKKPIAGGFNKYEIITIPYNNLKIDYEIDMNSDGIISFTITDSKGVIYRFNDLEIIHSNSKLDNTYRQEMQIFRGANYGSHITNWFLSQIELPNGTIIDYNYEDETVILDKGYYEVYRDYQGPASDPKFRINRNIDSQDMQEINGGELPRIETKRLESISSNKYEIQFKAKTIREDLNQDSVSNDALKSKALDKVLVYNKVNDQLSLVKAINFFHSYFEYTEDGIGQETYPTYISHPSYNKRLKLDSVQFHTADEIFPPYKFSYIENPDGGYDNLSWVPPRFTYSQDLWGYFNGVDNNSTLLPQTFVYPEFEGTDRFSVFEYSFQNPEVELTGSNRQADGEYTEVASLSSMETPTGTIYEYKYEPNTFNVIIGDYHEEIMGAGLRIKEVSINAEDVSRNSTIYKYQHADNTTTGRLISMPIYGYFDPINKDIDPQDCNHYYNDTNWTVQDYKDFYVRTPFNISDQSQGAVGYDFVIQQLDGSNGYIKSSFINQATYRDYDSLTVSYPHYCAPVSQLLPHWDDIIYWASDTNNIQIPPISNAGLYTGPNSYPFAPQIDMNWYRGLPLKTEIYNSSGELLQEREKHYKFFYANGNQPDIIYGLKSVTLDNNIFPEDGSACSWDTAFLLRRPYLYSKYQIHANVTALLDKEVVKEIDSGNILTKITSFDYNPFAQVSRITTDMVDGKTNSVEYKYPLDYWNAYDPPTTKPTSISDVQSNSIINLAELNILNKPVQTTFLLEDEYSDLFFLQAKLDFYQNFQLGNDPLLKMIPLRNRTEVSQFKEPVLLSSIENADSYIDFNTFGFVYNNSFEPQQYIDTYDEEGNVTSYHQYLHPINSYIWEYYGLNTTGSAFNCSPEEFSFNSFEENEDNWANNLQFEASTSKSGSRCIKIANGFKKRDFYLPDEQEGYTATVWVIGSSTAYIKMLLNNDPSTAITVSATAETSWELLELKYPKEDMIAYGVPVEYIRVIIGNTDANPVYFDDIRFHPTDATIRTNVFDINGNLVSVADNNNFYTFYEYNKSGRQVLIRNSNKEIISKNEFNTGHPAMFISYSTEPGDELTNDVKFLPNYKNASSYTVDFDDGSQPQLFTDPYQIQHYYTSGTYDVTMTVIVNGESFTDTRKIKID